MTICENKYKRLTIRELIKSFTEIISENSEITLDSEIIVSDVLMRQLNREFKLYTTFDYTDRKSKVGLFVNPDEDPDFAEEQKAEPEQPEVQEETAEHVKEIQDFTKQLEQAEQTPNRKNTDWFKKFA